MAKRSLGIRCASCDSDREEAGQNRGFLFALFKGVDFWVLNSYSGS